MARMHSLVKCKYSTTLPNKPRHFLRKMMTKLYKMKTQIDTFNSGFGFSVHIVYLLERKGIHQYPDNS